MIVFRAIVYCVQLCRPNDKFRYILTEDDLNVDINFNPIAGLKAVNSLDFYLFDVLRSTVVF